MTKAPPEIYFDPFNTEIYADPYPTYARLRTEAPRYYFTGPSSRAGWIVAGTPRWRAGD